MWKKIFNSQRGAMFSMDARIALVVASILAVSIGGMQMSRIERTKVENTDVAADLITKGIEAYYINTGITTIPTSWANVQTMIFDGGFIENQILNVDGWGSAWVYDTCVVNNVMLDGVRVPSIHYVAIYSPGKDGVNDSGTGDFLTDGACATDYGAWAPAGDDIGRKYSTLEIEKNRVALYRKQAQDVIAALTAYEGRKYLENQQFCSAIANQGNTSRCDLNADGYASGEEGGLNYYPRSDVNSPYAASYYVPDGRAAAADPDGAGPLTADANERAEFSVAAVAGSSTSMETLMQLINLPVTHAVDPWNRRLRLDSNVTGSATPPFAATVEFCTNPATPATCG